MNNATGRMGNAEIISDFFIYTSVLFLPFTQLFTLNIGFPLKIYEITIFFALIFRLFTPKINKDIAQISLVGFVIFSYFLMSTIINLEVLGKIGHYSYLSRIGPLYDGLFKCCYVFLCFTFFILTSELSKKNPYSLMKFWIYGAFVSALIEIFLFSVSIFSHSLPSLPGMPSNPQMINWHGLRLYRAATFLEGNFAGPYFVISAIMSIYLRKYFILSFLVVAILMSFSTTAFIGSVFIIISFALLSKSGTAKIKTIAFAAFLIVLASPIITDVVVKKFSENSNQASIIDRKKTSDEAMKLFKINYITGIGLAQFGLNVPGSRVWDFSLQRRTYEIKRIPNNVYAEILCEAGFLGFIIFSYYIYSIYKRIMKIRQKLILAGCLSIFIFWMSSPTFTMMYYWAYLGVSLGFYLRYRGGSFQLPLSKSLQKKAHMQRGPGRLEKSLAFDVIA